MEREIDERDAWPDPLFVDCEECGGEIPYNDIKHYKTKYRWASSVILCDECAEELEAREVV